MSSDGIAWEKLVERQQEVCIITQRQVEWVLKPIFQERLNI